MFDVDPYVVVRNSANLQAWRDHQRAIRAAAQPWAVIALMLALAQIAMFVYALFAERWRVLAGVEGVVMLAFGGATAIAGVRIWAFRRRHPLRLPAP